MTADGIDRVAEHLVGEQRRLERELETLESRMSEIQSELDRVDSALAALRGEEFRPRRLVPTLTKADVLDHVRVLLQGEQRLPVEQLRDQVAARLREEGRSLFGYPTRFEQAVAELTRVDGGDEVALPAAE